MNLMSNNKLNRWSGSAILFLLVVGAASALTVPLTLNGPTTSAQVGVQYSSALTVSADSPPNGPWSYGIQEIGRAHV